jgi:predicted nucleic acid-binding protein
VIHLDANYLIGAAEGSLTAKEDLRSWLRQGQLFAASSIAWAEFLNGPVKDEQIQAVEMLIQGRIIPFGRTEAQIAAALFNAAGRKRASRPDCFIAATAICSSAPLATFNRKDFSLFTSLGLKLA